MHGGVTETWREIAPWFQPPAEYADQFGIYRSPLYFENGAPAEKPLAWARRRQEILQAWHGVMGPWPKVLEHGRLETITSSRREGLSQNRVQLEIAPGQGAQGWLLVPEGPGPFPAVPVVLEPNEVWKGYSPLSDEESGLLRMNKAKLFERGKLFYSRLLSGKVRPDAF